MPLHSAWAFYRSVELLRYLIYPCCFLFPCFSWRIKNLRFPPQFSNTVLLGFIVALMFYSKYHGILIVFFTLISNIKLFTRWQTYFAGMIALVLFFPHLYWQHQHNYPSIQYHLFERNAIDYRSSFTIIIDHRTGIVWRTIIGWLSLWAAGKHKLESLTEKALRWRS